MCFFNYTEETAGINRYLFYQIACPKTRNEHQENLNIADAAGDSVLRAPTEKRRRFFAPAPGYGLYGQQGTVYLCFPPDSMGIFLTLLFSVFGNVTSSTPSVNFAVRFSEETSIGR